MRTVAYEIESDDVKLADATAESRAKKYDIIICQEKQYRDQVSGLLAAHPNLVIASYFNATHSQKPPGTLGAHPDSWYVWDKYGVPVRSKAFTGNYLMNPRSGWKQYVVDQIAPLTAAGYNAVYLDELGIGPVRTDGTTSQAVLPGTNNPWTEALWEPDMNTLLAAAKAGTSKLVYANGLGNGARYFATGGAGTSGLLSAGDRVLGESFLRGANMPTEPNTLFKATDVNWRRDIDMVVDAGPKGMFCCKCWSYPKGSATNDRVERWASGSFLLGCYPKSGWFYSPVKASTVPAWRPMYDTMKALGAPTADATYDGSKGHREFMHGYVDVDNGATDATITVTS